EPKLLLPDEPSAGVVGEERENFARFPLRIRHELHVRTLWVEHDMQMVTDLADRLVVLSQGEGIGEGGPQQVGCLPQVVEAYLGVDSDAPHSLAALTAQQANAQ